MWLMGASRSGPRLPAATATAHFPAVAATATMFVANPGTGLLRLNRTQADSLQLTSRLPNGAYFNFSNRDTNSGTRNVAALSTLALGPAPPGHVQMVLHKLGYDSTLRWTPAAGATGYEIVWRATDAPQWQYAENVGNVNEATVTVSKDDDILGVRSVGEDGLRSTAVYPIATRD